MRKGIAEGSLPIQALGSAKEVELAVKYGVSRDTARKARNKVLSEYKKNDDE